MAEGSSFCGNCGAKAFQAAPQHTPQTTLQCAHNGNFLCAPNNILFRAKYNKKQMTLYVMLIIFFILGGLLTNWYIDKMNDEIDDTPRYYMGDEQKEEQIEYNEDIRFFSNFFDIAVIIGFAWNCVRIKGNYLEITGASIKGTSFQTFGFTNVDFSVNINDMHDCQAKGNTLVLKTASGNYVCMIENNYQAAEIIRKQLYELRCQQ